MVVPTLYYHNFGNNVNITKRFHKYQIVRRKESRVYFRRLRDMRGDRDLQQALRSRRDDDAKCIQNGDGRSASPVPLDVTADYCPQKFTLMP